MFVPPFSWLMGIKKFAIFGFVTTLVLEGTPVDMLVQGLKTEYGQQGLLVKSRLFKSMSELKEAGLTLGVVKYGLLEDHWVTVLEVTYSEVVVGDPLAGMARLSYQDFCKRWRFIGIVLQRNMPMEAVVEKNKK